MTTLTSISEKLAIQEPWTESGGVHWLAPGALSIRTLAAEMNACRARFITITAYQLPEDTGFRLEYHWDIEGQLLGFPFVIAGKAIESIFDLCESVDWIEREIHEEYAIDFTGREYEPLLLREGNKLGVNLREEIVR